MMQDRPMVPMGWPAFGPTPPIFILFLVILLEGFFFLIFYLRFMSFSWMF